MISLGGNDKSIFQWKYVEAPNEIFNFDEELKDPEIYNIIEKKVNL